MALTQDELVAIQSASQSSGVPVGILQAVATRESGGNASAVNASSGATGLFQILPSTARDPGYGVTPLDASGLTDPTQSANFAASYLAAQYQRTGSWDAAISQYSGGGYSLADLQSAYPQYLGSGAVSGTTTGTGTGIGSSGALVDPTTGSDAGMSSVTGGGGGGSGGALSGVWEIVTRGGLFLLGTVLVMLALIAMLWQSKTVKTTVRHLSTAAEFV